MVDMLQEQRQQRLASDVLSYEISKREGCGAIF